MITNVLIESYWGIGDVFFQTPAIAMIRKSLPDATIYHKTMEAGIVGDTSVLYCNPNVDFLDPVEDIGADLTIHLGGYEFFTPKDVASYHKKMNHVNIFLDMAKKQLKKAGIKPVAVGLSHKPSVYLRENDMSTARSLVQSKRRVVLCRATKGCAQKTWPEEKWQELAKQLKKEGFDIVAVGITGDFGFDAADKDFIGAYGFRHTLGILSLASVYIGHGDGLMVGAYALDVPSVCVWGSFADPAHYFDLKKGSVCCLGHHCKHSHRFTNDYLEWLKKPCVDEDNHCITNVTVDEVIAIVKEKVDGRTHRTATRRTRRKA